MAPSRFDHGTGGTNYSSIHSIDAFVGDYQVMYTPGNSPPAERPQKKSTRFSRAVSSKSQNSQSIMLPNNIPNTSQIMADHGSLPGVQLHYTIPADEKQIIASLRTLQRDLNEAMQTINSITRERDEALLELRLVRAASQKSSTPARKNRVTTHVEEELFNLSRSMESPKRSGRASSAPAETQQAAKTSDSNDARVLSPVAVNRPTSPTDKRATHRPSLHGQHKSHSYYKAAVNDTENSIVEDPTAASNTSRRRRHLDLDENMTSAYILPDITVNQPATSSRPLVSLEAQNVLHRHDPEHVDKCTVCQRLTSKKIKHVTHAPHAVQQNANEKTDFTAQITQLMKDTMLEEPTMRPKISPWLALANVKKLLTDQFQEAKRKHNQAWEKYDAIDAPLSSKKHAAASQDLFYWSKKMEECRINLDQLRDVEEGMKEHSEL
ncbi:hypothetical protein LTR10_022844 [Elasticomyces elasticus]|uniref:Cep57 centrosome microtubule-binding domain-containing protein n=1 Tax=Exophiala sideris TaxID=1016849 RepID=A0ABR0JA45_9EURO|nr:hypothetical protein LTR10_022844 [Elasticomyces elasticus]KAK5026184.1 hypothetical protein LTS07_007709 [Exophiala sideris]KAK5032438.1 hypothetical protein LTR13_007261 [Exophiala sideris]KAK5059594.1 hypothetical protein LTR69_006183 [Exophiala sideris]KAK5178123.1 hypothetical protein LTR44_009429 [Eurotiomycetes sp. CCFEE 6388]